MLFGGAAIVESVVEAMYFRGVKYMTAAVAAPTTNPTSSSLRECRNSDRSIANRLIELGAGVKIRSCI